MLDLHLHSLEKIQLLLSIRFDSYMSDKTVTYYLVVKAIQATGKIIFCYNYYCYFLTGQIGKGRKSYQVQPEQTEPSMEEYNERGKGQRTEERY